MVLSAEQQLPSPVADVAAEPACCDWDALELALLFLASTLHLHSIMHFVDSDESWIDMS